MSQVSARIEAETEDCVTGLQQSHEDSLVGL